MADGDAGTVDGYDFDEEPEVSEVSVAVPAPPTPRAAATAEEPEQQPIDDSVCACQGCGKARRPRQRFCGDHRRSLDALRVQVTKLPESHPDAIAWAEAQRSPDQLARLVASYHDSCVKVQAIGKGIKRPRCDIAKFVQTEEKIRSLKEGARASATQWWVQGKGVHQRTSLDPVGWQASAARVCRVREGYP